MKSNRVSVRYKEDGGDKTDGVIYGRPGIEDVLLVKLDMLKFEFKLEGHYLKGMAVI